MPSISQSELKKKEFLVVRDNQTGEVVKVIFPNGIQVGMPGVENFNSGIILSNLASAPSDTTNTLYAINGNVYFNGVLIGAAGGANVTVKDEGSTLVTTLSSLNFTGAGVTATASGNNVTVTVQGLTVKDEGVSVSTSATSIDFVGSGITATAVGNAVTVTTEADGENQILASQVFG